MNPPIDEREYDAGKRAFNNGVTLLAIVKRVAATQDNDDAFAKAMSFALGFGDALLDRFRPPKDTGG